MSVILNHKIISYKGIIVKVSKLNHDTLFIYFLVGLALCLHLFHSIQYGGKISNTSMKLTWSDFWWILMNVISKYLFLEQFCQFSERVLKFFSKAGDSIHSFSSCTHIGALKTVWKCIFSWKSAYLYTSTGHAGLLCRPAPYSAGQSSPGTDVYTASQLPCAQTGNPHRRTEVALCPQTLEQDPLSESEDHQDRSLGQWWRFTC